MISKYFPLSLAIALSLLLFASCLGSSDRDIEYSPDAQIYAFSLSSRADTLNLLNGTAFTIDQVAGKIFNKEPLPYLFHVDSVVISITGSPSLYSPFTQIQFTVEPNNPAGEDSTYFWNQSDSVAVNRLLKITTTAQDGETKREYDFQLNIYQQDPYILSWGEGPRATDYLPVAPTDQKTVAFNDRFITYYKSGTTVGAASTANDDATTWNAATLSTLPSTIRFNSLLASEEAVYALDENGDMYGSDDSGIVWSRIPTEHAVQAIYGTLPSATNGIILVAVNDNGTLRFALTDDFSEIRLMNNIPSGIPVSGFTSASVEHPDSYSARYLVLAGGLRENDTPNNAVWLLQEKDDKITYPSNPATISTAGSSLFYYDKRLYLMTLSPGEEMNSFLISDNFGLEWTAAEENQAFPEGFTPRTNATVITEDNNIWVFGGISSTQTQLVDAWRAQLNKFAMD